MTTSCQKHYISVWPTLFLILLLIGAVACKGPADSEEPLIPKPTSVLISGDNYPILTIGDRVWTTANYYGPGGLLYKNGTEKPEYGRYYTFEEVKAVSLPAGWRVPTMQDYIALAESQGVVLTDNRASRQQAVKALASTTNWRTAPGTNSSGFNAPPAGYIFQKSEPQEGYISEFWTADTSTVSIQGGANGDAHSLMFYKNSDHELYRFNVRFVKDK